jgi:DNA-binding NarL/FixJ family response regulator
MSIRVCLADDHLLVLSGIKSTLSESEDIDVVAATQRGDELLELVEEHLPDLVLLDVRISGMDGIECVRRIKADHPETKVVVLSEKEDMAIISASLNAGASAYIGKRINPRDLPSALLQIVDQVVYQTCPVTMPAAPEPQAPGCDLTERELTMLEAICRGLSTKAISRELWIAEKTVKFHLTNIYRKLGVTNRTSAMRYAIEHDLIRPAAPVQSLTATA